jgi:hypothetical protein
MNSVTPTIHTAIRRYSEGQITASQAADLMGGDATVHDVIYQLKVAGLPLPRFTSSEAEMAKASKMFGLTP